MLSALLKLVNSGRWIGENTWARIIEKADKQTLLYLKNDGFWSLKYFTRNDWLGPEVRDRLLEQVNDRLDHLESAGVIAFLKGWL
jgi:hypothetical protein